MGKAIIKYLLSGCLSPRTGAISFIRTLAMAKETCSRILAKQTPAMLILYILLIALGAFPLILTIWRMRAAATIKKAGVATNEVITHINTIRTGKAGAMDILTLEYKDRLTNHPYNGGATVTHQKYKPGDIMPVIYLPDNPSKYAVDLKTAYWVVLIFCILLFLFIVFALYKINEMVQSGQM